jgi:NitT/TauT family transport system substrate-binding protein
MRAALAGLSLVSCLMLSAQAAQAVETVTLALVAKSFQYVIFPIAQERGYMKEEGIDLKLTFMQTTPSIQALIAGNVQFTSAGSSALVAVSKGGAPLKTVLAVNDRVHQWVLARPNITSLKDLKGKKVSVTGIAALATFMFKQVLNKHGLDGNKDVVFIDPGVGNRLTALLAGAVDAGILAVEERYAGLDQGMKELVYLGNEVKNSWGTVATSDRFIKDQPKLLAGFMRASLKALRVVRRDREGTISSLVKFTGLQQQLAVRMYDDLIGTFTSNGIVDEETQKNDLAIVRQVAEVNDVIPPQRAYDFSFAMQADQQLTRANWQP